tara:strand:+ start:1245 stop:2543 length:1299 start_codon:yes stop_codon:yes gene_type:complete
MIKPLNIAALLITLTSAWSGHAQAKDYIIALSPMQPESALKQQSTHILDFLINKTQRGDKVLMLDALSFETIGVFRVKDSNFYDHPRTKVKTNQAFLLDFKAFYENPIPVKDGAVAGVIKTPQLLETIGRHYGAFEDTDIILIGSPIYADLRNDNWSMTDQKYADDGHFNAPPEVSPFSLQGRKALLKNTRIHWAMPDMKWAAIDQYRYHVTRQWTIYIEGHGSSLASFSNDFATVFDRAANGTKAVPHDYVRKDTDKVETVQIFDQPEDKKSIYERELSTIPPARDILRQARNVEIGISWESEPIDLDLYIRPHHGAKVLYYSNRMEDFGYYHKDFTRSPKADGGFETVTLTSAVDLHDLFIGINHFNGASNTDIRGEIRLAIGDQTYGMPFHFKAGNGNTGMGRDKTLNDKAPANTKWIVIDPQKILGLK